MKIISLAQLIQALRAAYVVACNSLRTANKLKDKTLAKFGKSRAFSLINKIRSELKNFDVNGVNLIESVAYRGVLVNKI